jgi:hypothetical protein
MALNQLTHLVRIASYPDRRWMRFGRRHVLRIRLTITAEPSRGGHALLKCDETAICPAAVVAAAVIRTPWIVLRLGARAPAQ